MRKDLAAIKQANALSEQTADIKRLADGMAVLNDRMMRLEAALIANGLTFDDEPSPAPEVPTEAFPVKVLTSPAKGKRG